jgi:spore germination protein KC
MSGILRKRIVPLVAALAVSFGLTGCWDIVEVNQLAIINMIGIDRNPDTGNLIVYYQAINPTGIIAQQRSDGKAPVYTFKFEKSSPAAFEEAAAGIMPRKLFPDHFQAIVVSRRLAEEGLLDIFNYNENKNNRRSNVDVFITNSPISEVMNTYVPMEKLPGRSIRSTLEMQPKFTGRASQDAQLRDVLEHLESPELTVVPLIRVDKRNTPNVNRLEDIRGNIGNLMLVGGALFRKDRMIGELDTERVKLFLTLKGESRNIYKELKIDGHNLSIRAENIRVKRKLTLKDGTPNLKLTIRSDLALLMQNMGLDLNVETMNRINQKFEQQLTDEIVRLMEEGKSKGWDLLGVAGDIQRKRGSEWKDAKRDEEIWRHTKLGIEVVCKVRTLGTMAHPYKGE